MRIHPRLSDCSTILLPAINSAQSVMLRLKLLAKALINWATTGQISVKTIVPHRNG
jgi:hypothetical protein